MSKILIVSDSHGITKELEELKERHRNEVGLMIHCGDSELTADGRYMDGFAAVRGNCDFDLMYPLERIEVMDGLKIYVTHGHKYSVKSSLMRLHYRAREVDANIVCFGHSHILGAEMIAGVLFINPGSILLPRERREKTYVILDVREGKATLSVFELKGTEIPELSREFSLTDLE
jgi:putative phosphoesterase